MNDLDRVCVGVKNIDNILMSLQTILFLNMGLSVEEANQSSSSPLQIIESFLDALTNADKDGRVLVNKQGEERFVHYLNYITRGLH